MVMLSDQYIFGMTHFLAPSTSPVLKVPSKVSCLHCFSLLGQSVTVCEFHYGGNISTIVFQHVMSLEFRNSLLL